MPTPLTYGGFDLNHYAIVRLERQPGPSARMATQDVPGRRGAALTGVTLEPLVVVAHCELKRELVGDWDSIRDLLAAALCTTEAKDLKLPDEGGRVRSAVASFTSNVTEPAEPPLEFDVTFTDNDSCARGATRSVTVPSGGSVTIGVDGSLPTEPTIVASGAVRSTSTKRWGLTFDGVDSLHVETGSTSARRIEVDCAKRLCKVAGASAMVTLDSVWPALTPGTHVVRMDQGTGAATLSWQERWL